MKNFARIENGKVVERLDADELPPFHPSLHWEQCGADVSESWNFDGTTFTPPTKPPVSEVIARQWDRIKAERDRRKDGGVKVSAKWFHSDDGSRIQQIGLVMMGASIPVNLQWKTMDGSFITMTQALATSVFGAVAATDQAIFAVAEGHRVAMEASADPAAYDYSTGWPAVFGE